MSETEPGYPCQIITSDIQPKFLKECYFLEQWAKFNIYT